MRHAICLLSLTKNKYYVKTRNKNRNIRFAKGITHERISGGENPLFPYEVPYGPFQGRWPEQCRSGSSRRADTPEGHALGETVPGERARRFEDRIRTRKETHPGEEGRAGCEGCHKEAPAECGEGLCRGGGIDRQETVQGNAEEFFISVGARFGRIRKYPKGTPSPQHYRYCKELLQKLEGLWEAGHIDLYFGDESHVCTEGYVPYGWIFPDETCVVPSLKEGRLNIFGMVDRNCRYHGFTTTESIDSDKFIEFVDLFSISIPKPTVLVVDNASVHKSKKVKACFERWNERGLFIFYLPPYSPHLNIAETVWRILKGKWISPHDYATKQGLFQRVEDILSKIGKEYFIKFCRPAA